MNIKEVTEFDYITEENVKEDELHIAVSQSFLNSNKSNKGDSEC